jgi:RNA polymerase-binding transcription factor DksA
MDIAKNRSDLETQLAELEARLGRIEDGLAQPLDADSSERAVEVEDEVSVTHQALLIEREIASVRRALERIANGTYGKCVRCGVDIAPARLDARPEAALCIDCAAAER